MVDIDTQQTYTGWLELNLNSGKVQKYSEELQSQWVIKKKDSEEPDAVKMGVVRSYSLERAD